MNFLSRYLTSNMLTYWSVLLFVFWNWKDASGRLLRIGEPETRILGGKEAQLGDLPFQVSMRAVSPYDGTYYHFCGGSIINTQWILSAAHCSVIWEPEEIKVVVGTVKTSSGGTMYKVKSIIGHEDYTEEPLRNDIALLKIDGAFEFGPNIQKISLPTKDTTGDVRCTISGWGYVNNYEKRPDHLQVLGVHTISTDECLKTEIADSGHDKDLKENKLICTYEAPSKGTCQGDSGGPLVCDNELVGIVSFSYPCALGIPDAYVKVWTYMDWINSKLDGNVDN